LTGGLSSSGSTSRVEQADARVGVDQLPPAVNHHGWVGLVALEDSLEGLADRVQLGLGQAVLGVGRGVAARQQQRVAVAEGDVEVFGQAQDHVAGRAGAAGLDEAEMAARDVGGDG
jgi:hypothetical protein